jgi:hypothetical protein
MAWASHSLLYTFEISGGKEGHRPVSGRDSLSSNRNGQDQIDLNLLSALAERPEPVRPSIIYGTTDTGMKKREGDTWTSSGVNFSERNMSFDF